MKQFFLEFICLAVAALVIFELIGMFFPENTLSFEGAIYTSLGISAVYCIAKALENGYSEDAVDE